MSLQIWLPLINSIENHGISDCKLTTNNITYSTGKFYKAGVFSSTYIAIENTPLNTNTPELSFCFWLNTSDPTAPQCIYNGRTSVGSALALFVISGQIRFDDGLQHVFNYSVPKDTWVHYTITRDESNVKLYINGVLSETQTASPFTCTATNASIGISSTNESIPNRGNGIVGKMNDYRIYDHCLSIREVKEVAKGMVLHLPLNQPERNKNLVKTDDVIYGTCANFNLVDNKNGGEIVNSTLANSDTFFRLNLVSNLKPKTIYTLSFDCEYISDKSSIAFVVNDTTCNDIYLKNGRCYGSFTTGETGDSIETPRIVIDDSVRRIDGTQLPYTLKRFKVEEGLLATEYCPSESDKNTWSDSIEYDCSGLSNNGTVFGTISLCTDTPRYEYGYKFGANGYITCPDTVKTPDELTISIWGYMDDWSTTNSTMRLFSCTDGSGYNIEWYGDGVIQFPVFVVGKGYVTNIGSVKWVELSSGWHHFVGTYDGFNTAIYLDGVQIASNTTGLTTKAPIKYIENGLHIHGEAEATIGVVTKNTNIMNLSDACIYAVALSEEEILELYRKPVTITNSGTLMTQGEVKEVWK